MNQSKPIKLHTHSTVNSRTMGMIAPSPLSPSPTGCQNGPDGAVIKEPRARDLESFIANSKDAIPPPLGNKSL